METILVLVFVLIVLGVPLFLVGMVGQVILSPLIWGVRILYRYLSSAARMTTLKRVYSLERALPSQVESIFSTAQVLEQWGLGARVFQGEVHGFPLVLRTQPAITDTRGVRMSLPIMRDDAKVARSIVRAWIVLDARDQIPESLRLDVHFEGSESVFGSPALAAAVLDGTLRSCIGHGDSLGIHHGVLSLYSPFLHNDRSCHGAIETLASVARRIADAVRPDGTTDVRSLLIQNVLEDRNPVVRATSARVLVQDVERSDEAREAIEAALQDPDPHVRYEAARYLGMEGLDVVAEIVWNKEAPSGLRQRALRSIAKIFPNPRVVPIMERAVKNRTGALRQIGIQTVAEHRYTEAIEWFAELDLTLDASLSVDVADTLAEIGSDAGEPLLLRLLESRFAAPRVASADALGRVGTIGAVAPLLKVTKGWLVDGELRAAADTAVKLIQARAANAGGGALSLADGADGELSLAAAQGAVSEVPRGEPDD